MSVKKQISEIYTKKKQISEFSLFLNCTMYDIFTLVVRYYANFLLATFI